MKPIVTRHARYDRINPRYNVQVGDRRFVVSGWHPRDKQCRVLVYELLDGGNYRDLSSFWCYGSPRKPGVAAILKFLAAE